MTVNETAAYLLSHDNYAILTHRRPDGDTTGCAVGLCLGLRQLGKHAVILDNPQFTPRFAPYLAGLTCAKADENDTVVSVDVASTSILMYGAEALAPRIALAIDHHGSNSMDVPNRLLQPECAACGEIIFALLQLLQVKLTKAIADVLYIAVSTDTGCFKFSNTTGNTLRAAAAMVDAGASLYEINKIFFDTKTLARLQLESRLTEHLELYADGLVGVCLLPRAWIVELHISEDDIDSISGFARMVEGVEIGVVIRELEDGESKISLRTSPNYNASSLCQKLGGGGHAAAAGASVLGGLEKAKLAVLDVLRQSGITL